MEIRIKPYHKNIYPCKGILLKSSSVQVWLREIQLLELKLNEVKVYAIPGLTANSLWGCLLIPNMDDALITNNPHPVCQVIENRIFIPQYSTLFPRISHDEIDRLFTEKKYVIHPEFGFVELGEEVDWPELMTFKEEKKVQILKPSKGVVLPDQIKSFQVKEAPVEDVLENLEDNIFPQKSTKEDKPLSGKEKVKLSFLKKLFKKGDDSNDGRPIHTRFLDLLSGIGSLFGGKKEWVSKLENDFDDLEKRNQAAIDKLLSLFKDDPDEALRRAIPLDETGSSRGTDKAAFDLSKSWFDLSLFNNWGSSGSGSGGSAIIPDEHFNTLRQQYHNTARELINNGDYQKAAFIYMKLLKNYDQAAQTMQDGGHYAEAASIYLKYVENKSKAAFCYEKGNMTLQAIELYKDLGSDEKVGDLYHQINKPEESIKYYERVVEQHTTSNQFIKASVLLKSKMGQAQRSQDLLKQGWLKNTDALNCLNSYLADYPDEKMLNDEIQKLYESDTPDYNMELFLQVLIHEYHRDRASSEKAREVAYEIISKRFEVNPHLASELKSFNKNDKELMKDILRYKHGRKE